MKEKVIFRKFKENNAIIAIFPEQGYLQDATSKEGFYMSYMCIGQHSECDYKHILSITTVANYEEYKLLLMELESIGYQFIDD